MPNETPVQMTSADILAEVQTDITTKYSKSLKCFLTSSLEGVAKREKWIANRQAQVAALKALQAEILASYDAGTLDETAFKAFQVKFIELTDIPGNNYQAA